MQFIDYTTQKLNVKIDFYRKSIFMNSNTPIAVHFNLINHTTNHLIIQCIDKAYTIEDLIYQKSFWISKLA